MAKGVYQHNCGEKSSHFKHGLSNTRIYKIYRNILTRCYNSNSAQFHYYGGRNITVCDEWLNDFKSFYDWSMSHGYNDTLTIDRIDNTKGYSPDNCRWTTYKEQNKNKCNIPTYEYDGMVFCQSDTFNMFGIKRTTFQRRIYNGMSVKQAIERG